jgi:hypothetical protein
VFILFETRVGKESVDLIDKYKCGGCSKSGVGQGICFYSHHQFHESNVKLVSFMS